MPMFQQNPFGAHGDVMSAKPADDAGVASLLDEIKSRARAEFTRKNLPQAEMLYSKGIEVKPDDATLHSNLAAVRLGLNKPSPALENAEEAIRLDSTYAKGHYRKGQALMALTRPAEAAVAFRAGRALEPESKLWPPLVEKAVKAAEELAKAPRDKPNNSGATRAVSTTTTVSPAKPVPKNTAGVCAADGAQSASSGGKADSAGMKGYKKTADGRVTTYFHNELSEEAKALIGDIAPKKLETFDGVGAVGGEGTEGTDVSVWNKAGTWESRDMTSWAKQRLTELLMDAEFEAPESSVAVTKIEKLEGDAEISFSRGRKRYMFDFRLELKWVAADLEEGQAKGTLVYPDVGQDCDGVYDVECTVDGSTLAASKAFVDRHVRAEGSGLKQAVLARLNTFAAEFQAK